MNIRSKIILIVLPLLISALLITGLVSLFSARSGLTRVAIKSMGFKTEELKKYVENQWDLLVVNNFSEKPEYITAAQNAIMSYAETIIKSNSELIFAVDYDGELMMATREMEISGEEQTSLLNMMKNGQAGWIDFSIGGRERVGHAFIFLPFDWYFFVTDEKKSFYQEIREIMVQNGVILIVSSVISLILLLVLSLYLARPLERVVKAMRDITSQNDFSKKVKVEYPDEIGRLAHQFNLMTTDLERAYNQVKNFAIKEVVSRKKVVQREYETLNVLGKAAEYRDPETKEHILRVGLYSRLLAKSLGEGEQYQDLIYYAAPLHDIGKLGISDSILLKPGKLTREEFEVIKTHSSIAYEILKNTQSPYLQAGATIALTHHEKYNGKGYPNALKGEDIPLFGRIVGLVDVFDALTSKRPYKEPWPFDRAVDLLIEEKSEHFDPEIVDHFIQNVDEVREIYATYRDEQTIET